VRLEIHAFAEREIPDALESGRLDLAFGALPASDALRRAFLHHERYVVVMRRDHPLAAVPRIDRAALGRLEYVVVRAATSTETVLRDAGLADRVKLSVPHFAALPFILAGTDLAAVVPERLSAALGALGHYATWKPRAVLPAMDVHLAWSWRFDGDAGNRWLRERLVQLFAEGGRDAKKP
jgi:DNA-binding transcriptional LysR family regulator